MSSKKQVEGTVTVGRRFAKGGVFLSQDSQQEVILTRQLPEGVRPASVTAECAMKLNLGNYQMATVSAMVTVPCVPEEVEDALEFAYKVAGAHVERLVKEIKGDAPPQAAVPPPAPAAVAPWEMPPVQGVPAPTPASMPVQPAPIPQQPAPVGTPS